MSKEVVELFFKTSEANEVDNAMECFAEDGVWIDPDGKVYAGQEIRPYLEQQIGVLYDFNEKGITVNYTGIADLTPSSSAPRSTRPTARSSSASWTSSRCATARSS
jgi:hypothetical protein